MFLIIMADIVFSSPELMLRVSYCERTPSGVQPSVVRLFTFSNDISSETTGMFPTKLYRKHQCAGGTDNC